jgi:NADPH2:quinone reductase
MLRLMQAVIFKRFGDPKEVLGVEERPLPEPGPGQIRLKLVQSPIHNHDLSIIRGTYGYRPPLPAVPGTELLGTVDALGAGVTHVQPGQRVCAVTQGAWAEYVLASAGGTAPVPPSLPDDAACQLLAMPLSTYMLLEDLEVKAGDWVIQNAANGAVGRMLDTLARQREIKVLNLVRRQSTADELAAEGVPHVLATEGTDWASKVAGITGGAPLVRAIDSVSGRAANDLIAVLAPGGTLISFGALSHQPLSIDAGQVIFKGKTVKGFWATARSERTPAPERARMIGELIKLVAAGTLTLRVAAGFPLARAAEAAAASDNPGRPGKIAFRV